VINCPYYPSRFPKDWPFGETKYGLLDWSGTELVESSASATLALIPKPSDDHAAE
jgi:hypothetical protein